jgi:hypothetical protein
MGRFKVGQKKECSVSIHNPGDTDVEIERVVSNCACVSVEIDRQLVPGGRDATLRITVERPYPGPFVYSAVIVLQRDAQTEPVKITVRGEVISPVSARVGWQGGMLQDVSSPNPIELGTRHKSSTNLIVTLTSKEELDLRDSVVDVNSLYFCLDKVTGRSTIDPHTEVAADSHRSRVMVTFSPRAPLEAGRLRDTLRISLRDGSDVYINIVARIVGDVYLDQEIVHLGVLVDSPERRLQVLFAEGATQWQAVHWEGVGILYDAITASPVSAGQSDHKALVLTIDQAKASRLPRGYLFCKMRLYDRPDATGLTIFIDGYNRQPAVDASQVVR